MTCSVRGILLGVLLAGTIASFAPRAALAQLAFPDAAAAAPAPNPLVDTTVKPGKILLFDLEARFAKDVLERGGAAFAQWFAEDGAVLGNGAAPLVGRAAIEKSVNWSPKDYQLTWTPTDRRHRLHLGPLRGAQQGRQRKSRHHLRPLYHHLAQATRRQLEDSPRRGQQRAGIRRRLLPLARRKLGNLCTSPDCDRARL